MKKITGLEIIVVSILFAITMQFVYTQTRRITRFPRSERLDSVVWAGNVNLVAPVSCAVDDLLSRFNQCQDCMGLLQEANLTPLTAGKCPDVCLEVDPDDDFEKFLKCTEDDDPKYAPWAKAFTCPQVDMSPDETNTTLNCDYLPGNITAALIPQAQERGCPNNLNPDQNTSPGALCDNSTGDWWCTVDDVFPTDRGCQPLVDITDNSGNIPWSDYDPATSQSDDYYTITENTNCTVTFSGNITPATCYEYGIRTRFSDYQTACEEHTARFEMWDKDINCCKRNIACPGRDTNPSGLSGPPSQCCPNNVYIDENSNTNIACEFSKQMVCTDAACDDRDDWDDEIGTVKDLEDSPDDYCCGQLGRGLNAADLPTVKTAVCNTNFLDSGFCIQLNAMAANCLDGDIGDFNCVGCFQEIAEFFTDPDEDFFYEFVPKSNEALIIYWDVAAIPSGAANQGVAYFYTRVLVSRVNPDGSETPRNDLTGMLHQKDFANAFSVFAAAPISAGSLTQGQTYRIRLQYFIPNITGVALSMDVTQMILRIVRVRE